jgi:hypothetical protein
MGGAACQERNVGENERMGIWVMSKTGMPFCSPASAFQPHGHPLAGAMAVLYFYWSYDTDATA